MTDDLDILSEDQREARRKRLLGFWISTVVGLSYMVLAYFIVSNLETILRSSSLTRAVAIGALAIGAMLSVGADAYRRYWAW